MRNVLLAVTAALAAAVSAAPAAAQYYQGTSFAPSTASSASTNFRFSQSGDGRYDGRRDMRRRGRTDVVLDWYGGDWARYNNRSWDADSYNDWWHDRPDRAYPRWVTQNQGCERKWFSGDMLHC
jgi:hypothetical protein